MINESEIIEALPSLRIYARRLFRNRDGWEDLVQQTALRALLKAHLYEDREGSTPEHWLRRIMHNLYVNHVRRENQYPEEDKAEYRRQYPTIDPGINMRVLDLAHNLSQLPRIYCEAVIAASLGADYEEIGTRLRIPQNTVRSRLSRGRAMLRDIENGR